MKKINGRLNVNVSGVVSDVTTQGEDSYMIIDGEKVYIKQSSKNLIDKIRSGEYGKFECYLEGGKIFATNVK